VPQRPTAATDQNLVSSFELEVQAVPTEDDVVAYFTSIATSNLMNPIGMTVANTTQLARLCPIPHAWAVYSLDSKTLYKAWDMGHGLEANYNAKYGGQAQLGGASCQLAPWGLCQARACCRRQAV
jgi:hypothetical protein